MSVFTCVRCQVSADSCHVLGVKRKKKTVNKVVELVAEGSVINKSTRLVIIKDFFHNRIIYVSDMLQGEMTHYM